MLWDLDISVTNVTGDPNRLRVSGTPLASGDSYMLARVRDADGDPAWRTFYFHTAGGPGVILENSFAGTNIAQHLPWTATYVLSNGVTYSGWNKGAGIIAQAGTNALVWMQSQSTNESYSTLASAIASNEYWTFTLTPVAGQPLNLRKAEVRFTICRIAYNAPRDYAVFTSVGGFSAPANVYDTGRFTDQTSVEFVFALPDTAIFGSLTTPVEFRVVGYSGQYGSQTSLTTFKLTGLTGPTITTFSPLPPGTVGVNYSTALATLGGTAPFTWSITSGGLPDGLSLSSSTGVISGSPTAYGTWNPTIQVTDANCLATTQLFVLTINPTAWQSWQLQYFGSTNSPQAAPDADYLGKGLRNYDQFLAGLDPTNPGSIFKIVAISNRPPNGVVCFKTTSTGRVYRLLYTTNLVGGLWTNLPGATWAPGCLAGQMSLSDTNTAPVRFYKIQAQIP